MTTKKMTLEELIAKKRSSQKENKKALDQEVRPVMRWYPAKDSESRIRIVSAPGRLLVVDDREEDPFYERYKHKNIPGQKYGGLCLKRNGIYDTCPACELYFENYKLAETKEEKEAVKPYRATTTYFSLVLVRGEEAMGLRWWEYGWDTHNWLFDAFCGEDYFRFTDPKEVMTFA